MDRKDQLAAADAGIKDPASWNAKKTELAEKSAREQAAAESERLAKESVKAEARAREEEKRKAEAALPAGVRSYRAFLADPGDIDRSLKSVEIIDQQGGPLKGSLVRVTYRDANATSGQALLFQAANVYQEVAKIVADSSSDASGIQFIVKVGVSDQYGQPQQEQIAVLLSLPGSELKKINWAKFTGWDMLNLSSVDTRSVGRSIAREFCAEESHAKYAARFCRSARK